MTTTAEAVAACVQACVKTAEDSLGETTATASIRLSDGTQIDIRAEVTKPDYEMPMRSILRRNAAIEVRRLAREHADELRRPVPPRKRAASELLAEASDDDDDDDDECTPAPAPVPTTAPPAPSRKRLRRSDASANLLAMTSPSSPAKTPAALADYATD